MRAALLIQEPGADVVSEPVGPLSFEAWTLADTDLDFDEWSNAQLESQLEKKRAAEQAARQGAERAERLVEAAAAAERERERQRTFIRAEVLKKLSEYNESMCDKATGKWCCSYTDYSPMTVDEIVERYLAAEHVRQIRAASSSPPPLYYGELKMWP